LPAGGCTVAGLCRFSMDFSLVRIEGAFTRDSRREIKSAEARPADFCAASAMLLNCFRGAVPIGFAIV